MKNDKFPVLILGTLKLCLDKLAEAKPRRSEAVISRIRERVSLNSRLKQLKSPKSPK